MSKSNTVDELIAAPFSSREQGDRERIALEGRPHPFKDKDPAPDQSVYEAIPWLTCSAATGRFYCWPCLLFHREPGPWTEDGLPDVDAIHKLSQGHSEDPAHVRSTFDLKVFLHRIEAEATGGAATAAPIMEPEVARRLVDVVCTLAAMHRPPDAQICLDLMELVRKFDCYGKKYSDEAIRLLRDSPDIVIERVLGAVVSSIRRSIAGEVISSRFVSLILTRHSTDGGKVSSILRYLANGKVLERFVGYSVVTPTSSSVIDHVKTVLIEFSAAPKCVALSLGGAVLPCCEWDALRWRLLDFAPLCKLVPWHGHPLDVVLQRTLSFDPACDGFFMWLADLESFFCENPELCAQLNKFMPEFMPALNRFMLRPGESSPRRSSEFAKTEFLAYVLQNRRYFSLFFEAIEKNPDAWDDEVLVKAAGYRECLRDPPTVFFLESFAKILGIASTLKGHLAHRNLPELKKELDSLRVQQGVGESAQTARLFKGFKELLQKHVLAEIEPRFADMERFRFCGLFEFSSEGGGADERSDYEDRLFRNLQDSYRGVKWNRKQALAELQVLRQQGLLRGKTSVRDFYEYLLESNLRHSFQSLFETSELILALPLFRADLPPPADRIEKWSDHDLGIVFVESDYLSEIKHLPNFREDVFAILSESTSS